MNDKRVIYNDDFETVIWGNEPESAQELANLYYRIRNTGVATYAVKVAEFDNKVYYDTKCGIDWAKIASNPRRIVTGVQLRESDRPDSPNDRITLTYPHVTDPGMVTGISRVDVAGHTTPLDTDFRGGTPTVQVSTLNAPASPVHH